MIMWEPTPEGYIECFVNDYYGVVGLTHERTGWMARLESDHGQQTAPVLFHTATEAKRWIEHKIQEQWHKTGHSLIYSNPVRIPERTVHWRHAFL